MFTMENNISQINLIFIYIKYKKILAINCAFQFWFSF